MAKRRIIPQDSEKKKIEKLLIGGKLPVKTYQSCR